MYIKYILKNLIKLIRENNIIQCLNENIHDLYINLCT